MKAVNTLTARVTWAIAATVSLSVGLMGLLAYSVMYEQEDELAAQLLDIEMHRLMERLDAGELQPTARPIELGRAVRAWIGGAADITQQPERVRTLPVGPHEWQSDDQVLHALVADSRYGRIVLLFDATANERRVSQFGLILFLLWAACTAAGFWVARWIAGIVAGPLRSVTERITRWDPESTHVDAVADSGVDEPGRLLDAFNRLQDRVDQSMARQREFAANLSHEVRTPLAALRTDVEMTLLDAQADQHARLDRMLGTIDEIGATIGAARALSQGQPAAQRRTLQLASMVDEAWNGLQARAAVAGLRLLNDLPADVSVHGDRYALLIVLRNLIGNAIDHAAPATLTISQVGDDVSFADNGPGIDVDTLPFVFDRYHRGRYVDQAPQADAGDTGSRGLGLAIARRICQQQGWMIRVESATAGARRGTRFLLRFDENST